MKFHIERVFLWFTKTEKTVIKFENNKVNVIRGNSSRGKSNIFAIIDYCLMSDKPNIVEPVINECTQYYGLEFVLDGQFYAISRKKPEDGIGADSVYMVQKPFADDYYPNYTNYQVSVARGELDRLFGIKDDAYRYPFGEDEKFVVSFRSFLMFNALTENIIDNQYEYFNYKFFEDLYLDKYDKRKYLLDLLLGVDTVEEKKQLTLADSLRSRQNSSRNRNTRYQKAMQRFMDKLNEAKKLVFDAGLAEKSDFSGQTLDEQVEKFEELLVDYEPRTVEITQEADSKKAELTKKLFHKQVQLNNIISAGREYDQYRKQISDISDSLKPVEYLKEHIDELGVTPWSRQIVDALQKSLEGLREREQKGLKEFASEGQLEKLRKDIHAIENQIAELDNIKITPIQNSERYYALGRLKEFVAILRDLYAAIPSVPEQIDEVHDHELRSHAEEIANKIAELRATVVESGLNPSIQHYFDMFSFLENFAGRPTRYNREHERLEIGKQGVLNYTNIGSQSNYMFLHICFFLGLHRYLLLHPTPYVGQFLFIDQPSKPYYESSDNNKSTDRLKLMDAFKVINTFMQEVVDSGNEFQIILIEHAEETYWTGENVLANFVTKANFDGDNALVPFQLITKQSDETED